MDGLKMLRRYIAELEGELRDPRLTSAERYWIENSLQRHRVSLSQREAGSDDRPRHIRDLLPEVLEDIRQRQQSAGTVSEQARPLLAS